ncbi:hypothetical protein GCM10011512_19770 [Tersicoccus solisilvae]|uniref:Uncharacterized protein n=1 Tax=Tersicoccus solisilvae TaxID=1882339 RepID=A0ABQ1P8L0_9MICC|nr:hypothetical protein GCM10011512_19770 [Tersicoccus solisilvae]
MTVTGVTGLTSTASAVGFVATVTGAGADDDVAVGVGADGVDAAAVADGELLTGRVEDPVATGFPAEQPPTVTISPVAAARAASRRERRPRGGREKTDDT